MSYCIDGVNFHTLEVQKYWSAPASWGEDRKKHEVYSAIFSGEYIGARKMDGAFYQFIKDMDGNMELIGRSKSVTGDYLDKIDWVPHLQEFFNNVPNGTCTLGEIYFPNNEGSNHVTTIMGCLKDRAIARQEAGEKLHYYIFDILAWDGKSYLNKTIEERVNRINICRANYQNNYCEWAEYFTGSELWAQLQDILSIGGEGVVITKKGTCYQPGKRPARQTMKVKKELQENLDVFIIGALPPTRIYTGKDIENWKLWEDVRTGEKLEGTYYKDYSDGRCIEPVTKNYFNNWAGSLIFGAKKDGKIIPIGSLAGMTEEVLNNWKDYVGRVAEITGMQIHETGGIRHPKFVKWRPDLNQDDTDWYRIFTK